MVLLLLRPNTAKTQLHLSPAKMLDQIFHSVTKIGLWSGKNSNRLNFIAKFSIFCYVSAFILQLITMIRARDNLERLFECSSEISFCGMGFLKLYSLHIKGPTWLRLLKQMKQLEAQEGQNVSIFEYDSDDEGKSNLQYAKLKKNYEEKFKTIFKILKNFYRLTLTVFMFSPFIEYGFRFVLGNRPSKYPHILAVWTPLDDVHVAWYIVMVLIEAVAAVFCVSVHEAYDLTFIAIVTFVCGQCDILFDQCSRIGGRGYNIMFSRKRDERAHSRISYSHETYIFLVNAISTLDGLCKTIFGVYFLISTLTLCCIALRLKLESLSILQMARLLQYASGIVFQLYLCCTYGDEVLKASSINMGEGPFCAATWCLSPKVCREIVMLSIGMSQLRRLRAGPFNTVNLPSFLQIARAAYSCYAVVGQK